MTTPTREQVIEWAKEAGLPDAIAAHPGVKHALALAMSAGRDQGLREARECADSVHDTAQLYKAARDAETGEPAYDEAMLDMAASAADEIAAAIEQLRGK